VLRSTISTVIVSAVAATIIVISRLICLVSPSRISRRTGAVSTLAVVVGMVVAVASTAADVGISSTVPEERVIVERIVVAANIGTWSSSIPIAVLAWVVTSAIGASIAVVATSKVSHSVIIVDGGRTIAILLLVPLTIIVSGRRTGQALSVVLGNTMLALVVCIQFGHLLAQLIHGLLLVLVVRVDQFCLGAADSGAMGQPHRRGADRFDANRVGLTRLRREPSVRALSLALFLGFLKHMFQVVEVLANQVANLQTILLIVILRVFEVVTDPGLLGECKVVFSLLLRHVERLLASALELGAIALVMAAIISLFVRLSGIDIVASVVLLVLLVLVLLALLLLWTSCIHRNARRGGAGLRALDRVVNIV